MPANAQGLISAGEGTKGMETDRIDFVVPWVDGQDPAWLEQKKRYAAGSGEDAREERFRDWNNLRYWFRGVERFAPWVGRIHFVTWGHVPAWLNVSHPKIHVVRHEDYIPAELLPVFSSHPIELLMHKIEGLSERFVYFNDDFFLINRVEESFFFRDGLPRDMLAFQPVTANPEDPVMSQICLNNSLALSRHFDKRANVRKQPGKYFKAGYPPLYFFYNLLELTFPLFTGFYTVHGPSPFLKGTFREVWEKEGELLRQTCGHHFRSREDVNQYLFREWQKLSGNFRPGNITGRFRYYNVEDHNPALLSTIRRQKADIICINDANRKIDFEGAKAEIIDAFEEIFPETSSYEI